MLRYDLYSSEIRYMCAIVILILHLSVCASICESVCDVRAGGHRKPFDPS